jgi:diguanylate cyclase (GGDEF)-like protein/PAS domain S-box-containing protein
MPVAGDSSERPPQGRTLAPLRALLELSRLIQREPTLDETLRAVAETVSQASGFATVVVNQYLPDTDEYAVVTVYGNERARADLQGHVSPAATWTPMLDERFHRHGVYLIPEGSLEYDDSIRWHVPEIADPDALTDEDWHADDALFATLDGPRGRRYGIIAVDDPISGRRPDDGLLELLGALAGHAALAIESSLQMIALQGALARNRAVIASTLDCVLAVDIRDRLIDFNPAAERTFGYRAEEILGRDAAELLVPPEGWAAYRQGSVRIRENENSSLLNRRIETTAMRSDGSAFPCELTIARVEGAPGDGPMFYAFVRDISERRRAEEQMAFLAYHDSLTGLPNRVRVEQELDLALARARRAGGAVALMFVDLDDFKEVNDRLGHAVGDRLLSAVATRCKGVLRESDVLARQGGDEFLVLLSDLTEDPTLAAGEVAGKLLNALREPFVVAGQELRTGASIGISVYPHDARHSDELMRHADAAMYVAKAAGGGRLAFDQSRHGDELSHRSVSAQLTAALRRGELELHYQPVCHLEPPRAIVGAEAQLRWRHPRRGLLEAAEFISLADQSEIGQAVMAWVVQEVCRQSGAWQEEGLDPLIGFDVSPAQLLVAGFASNFVAALAECRLPMSRVVVELTESAWTVDSAEALSVIDELREAGASLLLDDFGAGYSSLSRLRGLAFDVIKIDGRLLGGVPADAAAVDLLEAVIGLTVACRAQLVADGVTTEGQIEFLLAHGITYGQGEALGAPMPAAELTPLLRAALVAEPAPHRAAAG